MSRIAVDCRFAALPGGIGRYVRELIPQMLSETTEHTYVLFLADGDTEWCNDLAAEKVVFSASHYSLGEQLLFPRLLRAQKIDLLFSPHFNVPIFCPVPFVCTIHDMILHRFPNQAGFMKRMIYRLLMGHAVKKSQRILTVSNATATDVARFYPSAAEKITVAYPGVDAMFSRRSPEECALALQKYNISAPFFFYVGNAKEHKNVQMLCDAMHALSLQHEYCSLVLVGTGKEYDMLTCPDRVQRIPSLPDVELASLYSSATAFVSPSMLEGFGLPFIEAMACGCPVIGLRDAGSVAEIVGEHGMLTENTPGALADAMHAALMMQEADIDRQALMDHAHAYTWNKTATTVCAVLQEAAHVH